MSELQTHPMGAPLGHVTTTDLRRLMAEFKEASRRLHEAKFADSERIAMLQALMIASSLSMHLEAYLAQGRGTQ